jgi:hypothetical protein
VLNLEYYSSHTTIQEIQQEQAGQYSPQPQPNVHPMTKKNTRKSQRAARSTVRALIPLDTEKIRRSELGKFKRSRTTNASLTAQLNEFEKEDVPAFQQWMRSHCGDVRDKINAAYHQCSTLQHTLLLAEELFDFYYPDRSIKECADAAVYYAENTGKTPAGFSDFFEPEQYDENNPFDDSEEEDDPEEARGFFESLMDDLDDDFDGFDPDSYGTPRSGEALHKEKTTVKKLYRSIIRKLHPDRAGSSTPEQQELWHTAKKAYEWHDIETLKHIDAHCDLLNKNMIRFASISSIQSGITFYKNSNTKIRRAIRQMKAQPEWGFRSWPEKKKQQLIKRFSADIKRELEYITVQRTAAQRRLDQMRAPPKTKQSRRATAATCDQNYFEFF